MPAICASVQRMPASWLRAIHTPPAALTSYLYGYEIFMVCRVIVVRTKVKVLAVILSFAAHSIAHAASIRSAASKEGKVIISLKGEISDGDADAVKSIIKTTNSSGHLVSGIRLDSTGGSILEATKLAELIRFGKIATVVPSNAKCASACFIVFAAGDPKFASYTASVGVHGASNEAGEETVETGAATVSMARIVKSLGVPASIIGKMVVTPPDQIVWLTPDDLRSMGTTMTGRPTQTPPNENVSTQPPMQLDPNAKAAVPPVTAGKVAPTWGDFVKMAVAVSAGQNGGNPLLTRSCQPELKVCNMVVVFKYEGRDVMVRRTEDDMGRLVSRDFCEFNEYDDIRTCVDWDSGRKSREMKNSHGDWVSIGNQQ